MVKRGSYQRVIDRDQWKGRRDFGRAGLAKVENDLIINEVVGSWGYVVNAAVLAAIAYGDALTIKAAGIRNTQDHSALPDTLRAALGNRLPRQQLKQLVDLLVQKDESGYGHKSLTRDAAERAVTKLRAFAAWAETELALS